jgi:DNA-binding MarR family transcriptional regulator
MSLALDRLEAAGWLVRSDDPDDGRRVVVELTSSGLALATRVKDALHDWEASLELSDAQQRETARVVDRLLARFSERQSDTGVRAPVATS